MIKYFINVKYFPHHNSSQQKYTLHTEYLTGGELVTFLLPLSGTGVGGGDRLGLEEPGVHLPVDEAPLRRCVHHKPRPKEVRSKQE